MNREIGCRYKKKYEHLFSRRDLVRDVGHRAFRGGAAVMGTEIASSILRIGSMAILARLLVPGDFGLLAMVTAFTVFAERFKDLGLGDATVQAEEINHEQISYLFWINFSICIAVGLFFACLAKPVALFYEDNRLQAVAVTIASTFVFSGLVIQHQALLRRRLCFGRLAIVQVSSTALSILAAVMLAYYGFGYWALVAREFLRAVFVVIGTWISCPWIPALPKRKIGVSNLLTFGRNVTGFNLVYFFSRSIDKILLGKFYGPYWVGIYTNAYQLISLPVSQIQYPVNTVALPALSSMQSDPMAFDSYFQKMVRLLCFVCMPCVTFLIVFADTIIGIVLGSRWTEAVPIFRILAIGAFIEPVVHAVGPPMVAAGKTGQYFRIGIIDSFLMLVCLAVGSYWGAIGIAVGHTTAVYFSLIARFTYGLRYTPVKMNSAVKRIATNATISTVFGLILILVRNLVGWTFSLRWLITAVIFGALLYLALWICFPGGKDMLVDYWRNSKSFLRRD